MLKRLKSVSMMLFLMGASSGAAFAVTNPGVTDVKITQQTGTCTGVVIDATGETVIGASVVVKGTTNGTITGIDGDFSLSNVKKGDIIQISFVGYQTVEIPWNGQVMNVTLQDDTQTLQEVVVTALGIKREKKALGYAMQEVKGDALVAARENNLANALSGKISGVQVIRSSSGPGGSSKIQLRGANSVTGSNQPLIVVDGVPMDNFTGAASGDDFYNTQLDMGNGLSDINPEDIESMSVLKGASAAALYGSRAGNGVILITTKKGSKREGLGITISASVSAETTFMNPKMQKSFGQGSNGAYNSESTSSWGPAMGTSYEWEGKERIMEYYDNVNTFFRTGTNLTENISFAQQYEKTSVYSSINRMDDASKIPGADLSRTNITLRTASYFGKDDRWNVDAKLQYINTKAKNRPMSGSNDQNMFNTMYNLPASMDIRDYRNPKKEDGTINWFNNGGMNPYWARYYNTNEDVRSRFLLNGSLKYKFTDWLNAEIRGGSDMYYTESNNKLYAGSNRNNGNSQYGLEEKRFHETNFSFLISAQKDHLFNKFGGTASFGGNLMERKLTGLKASADRLTVPDLFNINNSSKSDRNTTETFSHKKINSLYGTLGVNYDGWAFLDATFRNDWSSALSKENRSFFYPSLSASWVISDMVGKIGGQMPEWFTYAKARASFAQVGNDMDPYQLYNAYSIGSDYNGNTTAKPEGTKYDSTVRSELISSWEAGVELKFLNNRLGIDFAWYKSNAKRQLMNIPMNNLSGYSAKKINAGNIQNTGLEIMINARPIETKDFSWDLLFNFSNNNNKIIDLGEGIEKYRLGGAEDLTVYAVTGGNYGEIWGTKFLRVTDENSPHYGQLLLDKAGLPQSGGIGKIGEQQADCLMGITNTFSYKNFTFSFLIDGRFGGDIYSYTNKVLQTNGRAEVTAPGGKREDFVVQGVISDGNGGYTVNSTPVTQQNYWTAVAGGNTGICEANLYDATNIRLRNISLNYSFPSSFLKKTFFQQVKMGFSINNVWMISSKMNGLDPESVFVSTSNVTGFENGASPTSRSYLFNITLGF